MVLWSSCNINILRSLKSRDSFLRRKFNQKAPERGSRSCRHRAQLVRPTCNHSHKLLASGNAEWTILVISTFRELGSHMTANWKINSEIWLRKAVDKVPYYRNQPSVLSSTPQWQRTVQFSEPQNAIDLDLDLGSGQGHISMCNTYRTTSMPDHVTVASSSTEIWPFEIRVISTFREAWTHVIAVDEVPYYQFWATVCFELCGKMWEEIDLEKSNFRNFRKPVFLTFTLDRVDVTVMRIYEVYRHTKLDQNQRNLLWTYGWTHLSSFSKSIRWCRLAMT